MRRSLVSVFASIALVLAVSCVQVVNPTPQPTETRSGAEATATQSPEIEVVPTPTVDLLPTPTQVTPPTVVVSDRSEQSIADLVERARESVVRIDVTSTDGTGTGTGFAYSENLILTNAHVVEGVENAEVSIRISEGVQPEKFDAVVLGRDELNDLAVLRVTGASFNALELGKSSDAPVGTEVLAIGFPLGLDGDMSVTRGIVSRKLDSDGLNLIQHDAKILPGNSGGPLLTMDGTVVGINAAVVGDVSGKSGETLNFAIAIEEAERRLTLLENGTVDAATDRTFVSSTYGHSFDIPDGWFLIEESDESVYTYDEETQGFVSIQIDPDLSVFPNGQMWADYFYLAGLTYLDDSVYELIDEQITHNPDGSVEWYFLESFQRPGDDFMSLGAESFTYDDGLGIRIYVEAPESTFEAAFAGMNQLLESFRNPTIPRPGTATEIDRDCTTVDTEYAGFITNTTIGVTAPVSYLFSQYDCDLIGLLSIENENLVGSGTFIGYLDDNKINFNVLGITNDAGVDIEFSGTVSYSGIIGTYSVPEKGQTGVWDVESVAPYTFIPSVTPTPRPTSTPVPTVTPTPRLIPTPTPRPEPIDPDQDSWFLEGALTHDPAANLIVLHSAGVNLTDFIAEAEFVSPYSGTFQNTWDIGFIFHRVGGSFDYVVVTSNGNWRHYNRSTQQSADELIGSGFTGSALNKSSRDANRIVLISSDGTGQLILNGTLVGILKLGGLSSRGDVQIATGLLEGNQQAGSATSFNNFRVRGLEITDRSPSNSSGSLIQQSGLIPQHHAIGESDAVVEVAFTNPYDTSNDSWSYGFDFAAPDGSTDFVFIRSDKRWYHVRRDSSGNNTTIVNKYLSSIDTVVGSKNELRVVTVGSRGWLSVNGNYAGSFELAGREDYSTSAYEYYAIKLLAQYFTDDEHVGVPVHYTGLRSWKSYEDPNKGRPIIAPTPLVLPTISPTSTPRAISTPVNSDFDIEVQYDVHGVSGSSSTQNRLPTFNIRVAANQQLNQPPNVKLVVDIDSNESYSFQQQLLTASSGPVWEYSYTFTTLLPTGSNFSIPNNDVRWWVEVRAGNIGEVVEHVSETFVLRIDQRIPYLVSAQEFTALNSKEILASVIEVQWDGPLNLTSLSSSDFQLKTDTAIYVPLEIKKSDFGEDWIRIVFDRVIQDPGSWTITIQGTVQDLAGNSTDAGSSVIYR